RLAADPVTPELHVAPGNPGMEALAARHQEVTVGDIGAQVELARTLAPDLVVSGPEAPLAAGAADRAPEAGRVVCGPWAAAARRGGSTSWAKEIMAAAGVPTAASVTVTDPEDRPAALDRVNPLGDVPYVVKADGLAAGKGVVVSTDRAEALEHGRSVVLDGG